MTNYPCGLTLRDLRTANLARDQEWDPYGKINLEFRVKEFTGEVGELMNVLKKLQREELGLPGSRATREDMWKEFGDVLICLDLLAMECGVDLSEVAIAKFNEVSDKLGFKTRITP